MEKLTEAFRVINTFYFGAALWLVTLILYQLCWFYFCNRLDAVSVFFLLFLILPFLVTGFLFKGLFSVDASFLLNPVTPVRLISLICVVTAVGVAYVAYGHSIPFLSVMREQAYTSTDIGVFLVGTLFTVLALYQLFRLALNYLPTKLKSSCASLWLHLRCRAKAEYYDLYGRNAGCYLDLP